MAQAGKGKKKGSGFELAPQIEAIIVLDTNGSRLCAKYYSQGNEFGNKESQTRFEQAILAKANRSAPRADTDVLLLGEHLVLFISSQNIRIFLVTSSNANELIMDEVLRGFENALVTLLKTQIDSRNIIDNMDYVLLAMDELCEDGIIFETDGDSIAQRVLMKDASPLGQETLTDAWEKTKQQWLG